MPATEQEPGIHVTHGLSAGLLAPQPEGAAAADSSSASRIIARARGPGSPLGAGTTRLGPAERSRARQPSTCCCVCGRSRDAAVGRGSICSARADGLNHTSIPHEENLRQQAKLRLRGGFVATSTCCRGMGRAEGTTGAAIQRSPCAAGAPPRALARASWTPCGKNASPPPVAQPPPPAQSPEDQNANERQVPRWSSGRTTK